MVTEQFGPTNAGALFGVVFLSHQLGSFLGAWLGGELFDITGSYTIMWWTAAGLGVFAMTMHMLITEGRVNDLPPGSGGRIASAGLTALLLLAGFGAAVNSIPEAAALESTSPGIAEEDERFVSYCALGPTVAHGR